MCVLPFFREIFSQNELQLKEAETTQIDENGTDFGQKWNTKI